MMPVTEKIVCEVFRPAPNFVIEHEVVFGSKNYEGKRNGPLSSYNYRTNKYTNVNECSSYRLNTSDYLVFKKTFPDKSKEDIKILMSYQHIFKVKAIFKEAIRWFYNEGYGDIFISVDGIPRVNIENPLEALAYGLVGQKQLLIKPKVLIYEDQSEYYEGVTLIFSEAGDCVDLTIDQLESVYDFLKDFRLYEASRLLFLDQQLITPFEVEHWSPGNRNSSSIQSAPAPASGFKQVPKKTRASRLEGMDVEI